MISRAVSDDGLRFQGFEPIDANYVYCPNQFFDVCLPHYSRGVVRLVAHMLRQTLGFRDVNGNPIHEEVSISYGDFIQAGISRGSVRTTIDEAVAAGFIVCLQEGTAKSKGNQSRTARCQLRWVIGSKYSAAPKTFDGFYTGDGCRSPIPNAFFDQIVPHETLAVLKVVGTVLRYTVGYENQFGRRQQAPLSFSMIQKYTNLTNRTVLSQAVRHAMDAGYIERMEAGCFSPNSSEQKPAIYAVKWLEQAEQRSNGSKKIPAVTNTPDQFKTDTSIGSESIPASRSKKDTTRKTDQKHTYKQQNVAAQNQQGYKLLVQEGIGKRAATKLASIATLEEIQNQIQWLDARHPQNRPAMLAMAIEENWDQPANTNQPPRQALPDEGQIERMAAADKSKTVRDKRFAEMLSQWQTLSAGEQSRFRNTTIEQTASSVTRQFLIRQTDMAKPPLAVLETMVLEFGVGEST